jgi:hypothetical protein
LGINVPSGRRSAKAEIHEVRGLPVEFVAQRLVSGETPAAKAVSFPVLLGGEGRARLFPNFGRGFDSIARSIKPDGSIGFTLLTYPEYDAKMDRFGLKLD